MVRVYLHVLGVCLVVLLMGKTSFADVAIARAIRLDGSATITRAGAEIPFAVGMDLEVGDQIVTDYRSIAGFSMLDSAGDAFADIMMFGLAGPGGCATAGGGLSSASGTLTSGGSISLSQGTVKHRGRGLLGPTEVFTVKTPTTTAGVRGTNFATSHNPVPGLSSLSTLEGTVDFDSIVYGDLPDEFFTDPGNKSNETLDMDAVVAATDETTSIFDLLASGNAVTVEGGFYSTCLDGGTPTTPAPGLAPEHALPGGLCPTPGAVVLGMIGISMVGAYTRKRRLANVTEG